MTKMKEIIDKDPSLDQYFDRFRNNIIGYNSKFTSPYGEKRIYYSDWTASGRLYKTIEEKLSFDIAQFVGNTHSESNYTGTLMTRAYHSAQKLIKKHVNANSNDVILMTGSGMTGALAKLMRILGLKVPNVYKELVCLSGDEKPVVFITHMEHHSNQTSWEESLVEVVIIGHTEEGLVDLNDLKEKLKLYKTRKLKIASVTACSNVTGIATPYFDIARIMHENGGKCFVDFACSAPHTKIDMHKSQEESLDAIFFSPHKFLGGPGTPGVLVFCSSLYNNSVPDIVGGGTVEWTDPWGGHKFIKDIEQREDAGTPSFLGAIKTALAIKLKEEMGYEAMEAREKYLTKLVFERLNKISNLTILAGNITDRLPIFSFYIKDLHYNLGVKILNDRFGVQVRGGCSCAGTYGHYLLFIDKSTSNKITSKISCGIYEDKPGWIRMSLNPVNSDEEVEYILNAIEELAKNHKTWSQDYLYQNSTNSYVNSSLNNYEEDLVKSWFA